MAVKVLNRVRNGGIIVLERNEPHDIVCCDCGAVHEFTLEAIENHSAGFTVRRRPRSAAQYRRHKNADMLRGDDPNWKMVRKRRGCDVKHQSH